ncbi:hypothetical protein [Moorena producens]|uniref:hypothetical protein n=1 Tax=Moorena producens TaxID=1155739 RepID=UPI003C731251
MNRIYTVCLSFALAVIILFSGGVAFASTSTLPALGTYVSENNKFTIKITDTDSRIGQITGVYTTADSPVGSFSKTGNIGNFRWVTNQEKGQGYDTTPFSIDFTVHERPDGHPYAVLDTWAGAYLDGNKIKMAGVRSYVNGEGVVKVSRLGKLTFSK